MRGYILAYSGIKEATFGSSGFSAEGTLIFASAVPCPPPPPTSSRSVQIKSYEKKKKREREREREREKKESKCVITLTRALSETASVKLTQLTTRSVTEDMTCTKKDSEGPL